MSGLDKAGSYHVELLNFRNDNSLFRERPSCRIFEERFVGTKTPVNKVVAKDSNPKQLVEHTKAWFRMPAFQDDELLAKSEVLQHQVFTGTKKA